MYKLMGQGILRLEDQTWIPNSADNQDWQEYQAWLAEGNEPEPLTVAGLMEVRQQALSTVNQNCDRCLLFVTAQYPEVEMTTWAMQVKEAEAFTVDKKADIPLLSCMAKERGIALADLVQRVLTKANQFAMLSGTAIGRRQKVEDQLQLATTVEEIEALDLSITVSDLFLK